MGRAGIEPATHGFSVRRDESITGQSGDTCDTPNDPLGVLLGVLSQESPDLAMIVKAWPTLPGPIKAGILALIQAIQ